MGIQNCLLFVSQSRLVTTLVPYYIDCSCPAALLWLVGISALRSSTSSVSFRLICWRTPSMKDYRSASTRLPSGISISQPCRNIPITCGVLQEKPEFRYRPFLFQFPLSRSWDWYLRFRGRCWYRVLTRGWSWPLPRCCNWPLQRIQCCCIKCIITDTICHVELHEITKVTHCQILYPAVCLMGFFNAPLTHTSLRESASYLSVPLFSKSFSGY